MTSAFFQKINYSAANEDGASERKALAPHLSGGQAICISGSGARALELLIDQPERLVSIDFNATQSHLLELKTAAIKQMEHEEFLAFIGVTPSERRLQDYVLLKPNLSSEARGFWDQHANSIGSGVVYCGSWEYYLGAMATLANLSRGRLVTQLLNCHSIDDQRTFWNSKWKNATWNWSLKLLGVRAIWKYVIREPGIDRVPKSLSISETIKRRFDRAAQNILIRECAFAWLMFRGRYCPNEALPCHLEKQNFQTIKNSLESLEIETGAIDHYLAQSSDSFSAFSVSDFGSYAPPSVYTNIWKSIHARCAASGASVCEREFLVPQSPELIEGISITRDAALEATLGKEDRAIVYDFIVARL